MVELNFRDLSWVVATEPEPNIGSVPKFQVETSRILVLTRSLDAQQILLIIKMNLSEEIMKRIKIEGSNQDALPLKTCVQQEIDEINFETTNNLLEEDVELEEAIKILWDVFWCIRALRRKTAVFSNKIHLICSSKDKSNLTPNRTR